MEQLTQLYWFNSPAASPQPQAKFMVVTSGNCGAIWFAAALNLHPDIFAGCGIDHPIESCFRYDLKKDGPSLLRASGPRQFRFGAHTEVMRSVLDQHRVRIDFPPRDYSQLGTYVFDELEALPGAERFAALGTIHAFTAVQFDEYYQRNRRILGGREVVVTNMIRHPVPRTESFIQAFVKYHLAAHNEQIDDYLAMMPVERRRIEQSYNVSFDDPRARAVLFTYRIGSSTAWVANELRRFWRMLPLKMEDLQSDPEYFAAAVELLTGGRVTADAGYLAEVYKPENLGVGRRHVPDGARPPGPREQWEAWSDWERAEFRDACGRDPIVETYQQYGYDFSFLND
jgi:hypothetical protein